MLNQGAGGTVVADDSNVTVLQPFDNDRLSLYLVPWHAGLTAYVGSKFGEPKAGETVFVSAASGAVGTIVCQIA